MIVRFFNWLCLKILIAMTCCVVTCGGADGQVMAVRTYDENVVQTNTVNRNATTLSAAQMRAAVATAFDSGQGGVIDFDNGTRTDARTIDASYAHGEKSLRIVNDARDWSFGNLGTAPLSGPISGARVLFTGSPSPFPTPYPINISFGDITNPVTDMVLPERVVSFGLTMIDTTFNNSGINLNITVNYSNNTTENLITTVPLGTNNNDTFFGWNAPAGTYIESIDLLANNNTAMDDFAFITAPFVVPEPSSCMLAVACCWCAMKLRRR
jgi:hypothetical protein